MDKNLRRELILDNFNNPMNKHIGDESYFMINTNNESCIDNLDIYYKINDGKIEDICFDGEACAISTSATSVMIKTLIGKTLNEAREILNNYENMINEQEYDSELLGELNIYDEIFLQPNRKTCALLPFNSLKEALENNSGE